MRGLSFTINFDASVADASDSRKLIDKINKLIQYSTLRDVFSEIGVDLISGKIVWLDLDDKDA